MKCVGGDFCVILCIWYFILQTTVCVHYIEEGRKTIIRKEVPLGKVLKLLVLKLLEKEHSHPCAYEAQFQV